VLSEDKLRQREIERAQIENEIVNERRKMEGDLKIEQERLVGPLRSKLVEIVQEIGRKERFGLIVARGTPGVMYTSEAEDITNLVTGELNRKS
jgi:Skp family chaperone for outer membrane proteins